MSAPCPSPGLQYIPVDHEQHSESTVQDDFEIVFAPQLTAEQARVCLALLADYFRAVGGAGLQLDFELSDVLVGEGVDVLA